MNDTLPRLLTVEETAKYLRVSANTVFSLIKSGELSASKVGKQFRITQDTLHTFLQTISKTEGDQQ